MFDLLVTRTNREVYQCIADGVSCLIYLSHELTNREVYKFIADGVSCSIYLSHELTEKCTSV